MRNDMSRGELAAFVLVLYAWFAVVIIAFGNFPTRVALNGDNPWYAAESAAFRGAAEPGITVRHFPGFPLAAAAVVSLTRISDDAAIVIVSLVASFAAVMLAGELWGGVIAAWFAILNLDWFQRSILGGAEPLFALLLFLAIRDARRERWARAALFAALATVVRPLGVFALVAIGIALLRQRKFRTLAASLAISAAVAAAYFALMHAVFGDALLNFRFYRGMGLGHDRTFVPFVTLALSYRDHLITLRNVVKTLAWTAFTFAAVFAAVRRKVWQPSTEWLFAALYLASFLFFPAWWIEGESSRYLTPVIPLLLVGVRPWIPSNRFVMWVCGVAMVTIAAIK